MVYCRKIKDLREIYYLMCQEVFIPTRLRFCFCLLHASKTQKFIEIDADAFLFLLSSEMIFVLLIKNWFFYFGNSKCHSDFSHLSFSLLLSFNSPNGSIHYYLSLKMQKEQIWSLYAISHTCIYIFSITHCINVQFYRFQMYTRGQKLFPLRWKKINKLFYKFSHLFFFFFVNCIQFTLNNVSII